jgi:hypothetical protein
VNFVRRLFSMSVSPAHKGGVGPTPKFAGSLLVDALPDIHLLAKTMATGGVKRQQFDSRQPASFCPPLPRTGPISKSEDAKIFRPTGNSARIKPGERPEFDNQFLGNLNPAVVVSLGCGNAS